MFRSIISRKLLSGLALSMIIGVPGVVHAQTKSVLPKPAPKPGTSKSQAPDATPKDNAVLSSMSMQIGALQTLRQFQFDNDQLEKIAKIAAGQAGKATTITPNRTRAAVNASKEVREKMVAIR